jgi:hypothetical protein
MSTNCIPAMTAPRLAVSLEDRKTSYCCSLCGREFIFYERRIPKEAAAELLGAFKRHVQDEHTKGHKP